MIHRVAHLLGLSFLVAATVVLPAGAVGHAGGADIASGAGDPEGGSAAPGREEALAHYLAGRLLEERGLQPDALEEYFRALALDPDQPGILIRISEVAARRGESSRALEHAERVLARTPGDARALWLKGSALFNMDRVPEALQALEGAVSADSAQVDYWRTLAHVAEAAGRVRVVADCWRHAVRLEDDDAESWFQLAAAEARLGRFQVADSVLQVAVSLNPVRPGILFLEAWIQENMGRVDQAVRNYRHHLEAYPDDLMARRRLVNLLVDQEQYRAALQEAEALTRASPGDPDALSVEADLALRLGRVERATQVLDRMEGADNEDPSLVARAAGVLSERGRRREALLRAERWAGRHPVDYRGPLLVAQVRAASGDAEAAIAAARSAVAMAPDSLGPRFVLGGLLQSGRHFAAAESVWADLTQRSRTAQAGLSLAYCREQMGKLDGAVSAARDVLAVEPDNASALNFLGYLFADHNRNLDEAEDLVRRALLQEPDNGSYVDSMGWVYYRQGRLADARRELERAIELTRGDPVVREHLGDVYKDLKLFELARDQYERSLRRDRENARVRAKLSEIR